MSKAETLAKAIDDKAKLIGENWQVRCPCHEDDRASLSIKDGTKGGVVLYCHASCDAFTIKAECKQRGIWPTAREFTDPSRREIECTYRYTDGRNSVLYEVVRYKPKDFRQRRPDGMGGYIWNLDGVKRVLYKLPRVREAKELKVPVVWVEGEKDADRLTELGFYATTNCGGANKWNDEYTEELAGMDVVIIPDNDEAGEKFAKHVARELFLAGCRVYPCHLDSIPIKGDVSDWLKFGHTAEELNTIIKNLDEWAPQDVVDNAAKYNLPFNDPPTLDADKVVPITPAVDQGINRDTDLANTKRLVANFGQDLRWNRANGWYHWTGSRWKDQGKHAPETERCAKKVYEIVRAELLTAPPVERELLAKCAKKAQSSGGIASMITLAKSENEIMIEAEDFDNNPYLFNCKNGIVNLQTGEFFAHQRKFYMTKCGNTKYNPDAKCPVWESFLTRIMANDTEMVSFLQRLCGYFLTGLTSEEILVIAYGSGQNGKSKFYETIKHILGDYSIGLPAKELVRSTSGTGDGANESFARLFGTRLACANETDNGDRLDEATVKDLTGGDTITARMLYGHYFEFRPTHKIILRTNHKPIIKGTDEGIWRRICLIPFAVSIPMNERDLGLLPKLFAEADGILAWMVRGAIEYFKTGLRIPGSVTEAAGAYREEMDTMKGFLQDYCDLERYREIKASHLYGGYTKFCQDNGFQPLNAMRFGMAMRERGFKKERESVGYVYKGIALKNYV